jgi:hypothetical protein
MRIVSQCSNSDTHTHCTTASLYHYITAPLHHCTTAAPHPCAQPRHLTCRASRAAPHLEVVLAVLQVVLVVDAALQTLLRQLLAVRAELRDHGRVLVHAPGEMCRRGSGASERLGGERGSVSE